MLDRRTRGMTSRSGVLAAALGAKGASGETAEESSGRLQRSARPRVLLVDDSQHDRAIISHLLRAAGSFDVTAARDADEANVLLQEQSFDCLLVDVNLPRQNGMEFLQSVQHQFGKNCPPIILMTASDSRDVGVVALKGGADDFLTKDSLHEHLLRATILDAIQKRAVEHAREQRELESRMRSLGQLAAGIAHELNNPAAYVRVNLDVLEEALQAALQSAQEAPLSRADVEQHLRLVQECSEGLERMTTIVSELQSFTKSGPSSSEPVHLDDVVRSSARFLAAHLRSVRRVDVDLGAPPPVIGSHRRLVQVVVNLLTNAIDAANPDEPHLRISTRSSEGQVELRVEDNGPGIPPALRERIFEPFFTTKGPGQGTGLGLSLCCEYVTQAGGTLTVETSPLGGAKFRISLPMAARRFPTAHPPSSFTRDKQTTKATVLAVDDEPSIRRAYARVLSSRYQVYTAGNGKEALEVLQQHRVDAVVCDLAMPDMDGRALLRAIEERWPALASRVVFCTGGDVGGNQRDGDITGNRILGKPVSKVVLEDAIEDLLALEQQLS